nr:uncharacterized protein LOC127321523 [Lolium perenne]
MLDNSTVQPQDYSRGVGVDQCMHAVPQVENVSALAEVASSVPKSSASLLQDGSDPAAVGSVLDSNLAPASSLAASSPSRIVSLDVGRELAAATAGVSTSTLSPQSGGHGEPLVQLTMEREGPAATLPSFAPESVPVGDAVSATADVATSRACMSPCSSAASEMSSSASSAAASPPPSPKSVVPPRQQPPAIHRRSSRHAMEADGAKATDEDTMTKAMRRKAAINLDPCGYLQVHRFAPFVVFASTSRESRPLYGGIYTIGGCGEGYFFPTWMAA